MKTQINQALAYEKEMKERKIQETKQKYNEIKEQRKDFLQNKLSSVNKRVYLQNNFN